VLPTRQLCGTTSTLAYLVLLRVEIARFTRSGRRPLRVAMVLAAFAANRLACASRIRLRG